MSSRLTVALLAALFFNNLLLAQPHEHSHDGHHWCGKNHVTQELFEKHPEAILEALDAAEALEAYTAEYALTGDRSTTLTVPVVFHIVHNGGPENISDAQVHSAINMLNEDFSASNPELSTVNTAFQGIVGNANIQFALAKRDPNGNCTNGIVRAQSTATNNAGIESLTQASPRWPRNRYLNIYVCESFPQSNLIGFTLIPSSVNGSFGAQLDGIYIRHYWVGNIGTAVGTNVHSLTHEVGHWINLEHTWGVNGQPGDPANCNDDDFVSDTPNTVGYFNCPGTNVQSCGSLDNIENFMDYSACEKMFTQGQILRMRAALTSSIAQRNQLHTTSNLNFTGVSSPGELCEADFRVASVNSSICVGDEVAFEDLSYHNVTERIWNFPGGTPSTSSEANPVVTYNEPGLHNVSLTVISGNNSELVSKSGLVHVKPSGSTVSPLVESFEGFSTLHGEQFWSSIDPDGDDTRSWELFDGAGYTGNKSVRVLGRFNTNGATEWLETPTIDLSNVSGNNAVLHFKYAHARRNSSSNDELRIWISRNCGETWNLRRTILMENLPTVPNLVNGSFVPANQGQWDEVEVSTITSVFLNPDFKVRFEFVSFNGNNIYIDDINVYDANSALSTDEWNLHSAMNVYPNPAHGHTTLEYTLSEPGRVSAEIIDLSGAVVDAFFSAQRGTGTYIQPVELSGLAPGVYFIRLTANDQTGVKKLVVQ